MTEGDSSLPSSNPVTHSTESVMRPANGAIYGVRGARRVLAGDSRLFWWLLLLCSIGLVSTEILVDLGHLSWAHSHVQLMFGALALIVAAAAWFIFSASRVATRERSILQEIFHGTALCRLVTDISRQPILLNDSYRAFCTEFLCGEIDSPPGLRCLRRILEPVSESLERFDLMVDLAYRGSTEKVELSTMFNGYRRWLRIEAQPVPGWIGNVSWGIQDITEEHELESAVRAEREKLIDFTDNAPVGFFSIDESGKFQFANDTLLRLLGTDSRPHNARMFTD